MWIEMADLIRTFAAFCFVISTLMEVAHGLRNLNASEVSSCTEKKDGVEYTADLAMDGDASTCAKTCYQKGGWIRVTLPRNDLVNKIKIRGYMPEYTQIRLGDDKSDFGFRDGFFKNAPCILQTDTATAENQKIGYYEFICTVPRAGTVLSFRSGDTDTSPQLVLCDVEASYDQSLSS